MARVLLVIVSVFVVVLIGGTIFLMAWNIPAPSNRTEHAIPDARFPR